MKLPFMRIHLFTILTVSIVTSFAQKKKVCFSYDDLPVVSYGMTDSIFHQKLITELVASLKKNKIPAIGFVNEIKLYNKSGLIHFQVDLLNRWVAGGLALGNHSYSHLDYNVTSFDEFTKDILRGETITKSILSQKGMLTKYFRHPYLHMGNTKTKADSLTNFLFNHGYEIAPVTIDNEDYLFAQAYHTANVKKDTALMNMIGSDYINYMESKLKYYEKQADKLLGREITHILLLHASLLNSDYMDSLALMFKNNNYDFVSIDKALEDKVYKTRITSFGDWGISWIDRWALSSGKKSEFFKGEPETPDYIVKLNR